MWYRSGLAALAVLVGFVSPAASQVKLEWKLSQGDVFYAETVTTLEGYATEDPKAKSKQGGQVSVNTVVIRFTVKEVTTAGYVLEEKITHFREKASGGVIGHPLAVLQARLAHINRGTDKPEDRKPEIKFTITVSRSGQVLDFKGYEEGLRLIVANEKSAAATAKVIKILKSLVTKDSLQKAAQEIFVGFPEQPLKAKAVWKKADTASLGALGTLDCHYRYQYQGNKEGEELIVVEAAGGDESSMKYLPPKANASRLPFKILSGNLSADKASGTIRFNAGLGRPVVSTMAIHFQGTLTFEVRGKSTTLYLEQDQKVVTRILAKNPLR